MSSVNLDIKFKKANKVYHEGVSNLYLSVTNNTTAVFLQDNVTGVIIIETSTDFKHDGISLTMEGAVNLQISSKNVGIIEAFIMLLK